MLERDQAALGQRHPQPERLRSDRTIGVVAGYGSRRHPRQRREMARLTDADVPEQIAAQCRTGGLLRRRFDVSPTGRTPSSWSSRSR